MKKVFYIIVFFILFFVIQRIPYIFDHKSVGFPLTTYTYWFTDDHVNQWSTVTTTHVVRKPNNIYINFALYTLVVFSTHWYFTRQNVFKLLANGVKGVVKSKEFKKTIVLLGYSFIIFAVVQFLPFSYSFENGMAKEIGFPIRAYYVVNAQCYMVTFFEPLLLIINFIIISVATFSMYFIIQLIRILYTKLQPRRSGTV